MLITFLKANSFVPDDAEKSLELDVCWFVLLFMLFVLAWL